MKSLLEYSYQNCQDISFETLENKESLEKDIYDKVVDLAREKIKKALKKQMNRLVLRTIYLLKTKGIHSTIEEIIGSFDNYKGSLWKIAMLHATASFIFSKEEDRLLDILDTCNAYFPCNCLEIDKKKVVEKMIILKNTENPDLFQYIEAYYAIGNWLLP